MDHEEGRGSFGAVIHYQQLSTFKNVAVKILATNNGIRESKMLDKIKCADPDKNNLLKLVEHFSLGLQHCIVFEKLDQDVLHFMSKRNRKPMEVSEIRPIAQQILVALNALKSMGLAHTDIKPDNLMLVNHATHPFKVKLIDFGLARNISDLKRTSQIQALGVDMWSLGCSLVFMYFFKHLYPRTSEYEYIATIVRMHGTPPDHVLREGLRVHDFFSENKTSSGNKFKFKIPTEYMGNALLPVFWFASTGCLVEPAAAAVQSFGPFCGSFRRCSLHGLLSAPPICFGGPTRESLTAASAPPSHFVYGQPRDCAGAPGSWRPIVTCVHLLLPDHL
uniref:Protein kinase domain-containing protein n=1 Tax=Oryzias latipes TaxID=8090 RepID=A0A3B3HXQ8_ORYLA